MYITSNLITEQLCLMGTQEVRDKMELSSLKYAWTKDLDMSGRRHGTTPDMEM